MSSEIGEQDTSLRRLIDELLSCISDDNIEPEPLLWQKQLYDFESYLKTLSGLEPEKIADDIRRVQAESEALDEHILELAQYKPGELETKIHALRDRTAEKVKLKELNDQLGGYSNAISNLSSILKESRQKLGLKKGNLQELEAIIPALRTRASQLEKDVEKRAKEDAEISKVLTELPGLMQSVREAWTEVSRLEGVST